MATCPYCRTANRADAVYCNMCGGLLKGASAAHGHPLATPTNATGRLTPNSQLHTHYEILATVGQGGMAAVYKARELTTGAILAIKEMSQDGLPPDDLKDALASFTFEADTLRRLRHPNLPRVYERFAEHFRQYLVMDFVEGQTLEQRLQAAGGQPLPQAEVLAWARQICDVLTYLHGQKPPIIFRDLKPANIMLTRDGHIYLIDFGIARVFAPGRTKDTQVLGTPGFAPPEQYGKAQTDQRADIYALGCTLYQLLTAYDPATTPFNLPPMRSRVASIAPGIQRAIERATRLNRDERYPTIAAFAADLLAAAPTTAAAAAAAAPSRATATAPRPAGTTAPPPSPPPSSAARKAGQAGQSGQAVAAIAATAAAAAASALKTTSPAAAAALQSFARMAAPPPMAAIVVVQPPQVNFGKITAGQRTAQAITISGQGGMTVRGHITPLNPWLSVDQTSFAGKATVIQVIARPDAAMSGDQQSTLQISCDGQQLFVPVTATIQPAKGKARTAASAPGGRPSPAAKKKASARPSAAKHTAAPVPSGRRGVGFVTSATLGVGAAGAAFMLAPRVLPTAYTRLHAVAALPLLLALGLFGVAALLAGIVAVLGSGARPTLPRLATGILGALISVAVLLLAGSPWVWPPLTRWLSAPVALAPPLLVVAALCAGLGAAVGGDPLLSQWMRATGRFVVRYSRLLSAIALVLGGAYLGWVLTNGLGFAAYCLTPMAVIGGAAAGYGISRLLRPALPRATYRRSWPVRQWP